MNLNISIKLLQEITELLKHDTSFAVYFLLWCCGWCIIWAEVVNIGVRVSTVSVSIRVSCGRDISATTCVLPSAKLPAITQASLDRHLSDEHHLPVAR